MESVLLDAFVAILDNCVPEYRLRSEGTQSFRLAAQEEEEERKILPRPNALIAVKVSSFSN